MFDRDYVFYGKYAHYAKYLCKDKGQEKDDRANVFNREIDVLMVAPLVGVIKNSYIEENDNDSEYKDDKSTVQLSQLNNEIQQLKLIYRAVMLANSHDEDLSEKDKITQAFKFDDRKDADNPGMKIFNSYMRGGLEYLYNVFKKDASRTNKKKEEQALEIVDLVNSFEAYKD